MATDKAKGDMVPTFEEKFFFLDCFYHEQDKAPLLFRKALHFQWSNTGEGGGGSMSTEDWN